MKFQEARRGVRCSSDVGRPGQISAKQINFNVEGSRSFLAVCLHVKFSQ